jgi:Concanavalin A-like lectin/glucanases superfamily/Domain of unknown function (DUF2341)/Carbohydrate esterase, sialic acid-specific acetylesterase
MIARFFSSLVAALLVPSTFAADPRSGGGEITILTTPEGADLPAGVVVEEFPLLVRLHRDGFDFSRTGIHFTDAAGKPLAHQIDDWDAAGGSAAIWVRIPQIEGNARQTIRMHWGDPAAVSKSGGKAVFDAANGYLSVWHLGETVEDEVGTLVSKDSGTTVSAGRIGKARTFPGGKGVFCGEDITGYPAGNESHSTEAWFRATVPNVTLIGWGNEPGGRGTKVRMQLRSPPHLHIDSNFSDVQGKSRLPLGEWVHVMHTHRSGESRVYINGKLDGEATPELRIQRPVRLWLGGWYDQYDFTGELDEVRVSKVARSAEWVKLQYENQKPQQTLVGPLVQAGNGFSVVPERLEVSEGTSDSVTLEAGGAQKVYWILKRDGQEEVVASDRFTHDFHAGRVSGDAKATLQVTAVYPDGVKTKDVPIVIRESIADPEFKLEAPAAWDGRSTIEIVPRILNAAGEVKVNWDIAPLAVIQEVEDGKLVLKRAQNSGTMIVTATMDNGGQAVKQSVKIDVTEPAADPWIARVPEPEEKPEDGQFYARDDKNEGTLFYKGSLPEDGTVFLKVRADGKPYASTTAKTGSDKSYAFEVKLKPGKIRYDVEFGTLDGNKETLIHKAADLVCGDAFLINGQSNAVAMDWGPGEFPETSEWIRSFGSMGGDPKSARWGRAIRKTPGDRLAIGYWGYDLAKRLVETQGVPICMINGAVGGTRIDQHQRNAADPADLTTIYGRLLWRVREARLTHGIRGVLWHQGENDQGADGPSGGFGWETYRPLFIELAAAWKQDFPNLQHHHVFQIWPKSCAMGFEGSDNRLREVQRQLPSAFSNLSVMSTLGIDPPGGCHYPAEGYAAIARLIAPLVERNHYGKKPETSITAPDLTSARFADGKREEILLEFDQPVVWNDTLASEFYLDGEKGRVASGSAAGNLVTLKLKSASPAATITYLDGASWNPKNLLRGVNGIAALTFCEVPLGTPVP